jgi:predicted nucleotide-binding protein (sugar kinase/HSP70/actin superfamily)
MFNVSDPRAEGGLDLGKRALLNIILSLFYGDILMRIHNQCVPYEIEKGSSQKLVDTWVKRLVQMICDKKYSRTKATCDAIVKDFAAIKRDTSAKMKVGNLC